MLPKHYLWPLLILLVSFNVAANSVGEKASSSAETHDQVMQGIAGHGQKVFERRRSILKTPEDLISKFSDPLDQDRYQAILNNTPKSLKWNELKIKGDYLVSQSGGITLKVPLMNMFEPHLMINKQKIEISKATSFRDLLEQVERVLDQELAKTKKVSYLSWIISEAQAQSKAEKDRFKNILLVNSSGLVYLTVNGMAFWRDDIGDLRELLVTVESDLKSTQVSCEELKQNVGVSEGAVPVYKMLNKSTAETLENLIVNNEIDSRTLLRNAFARHATRKEHKVENMSFTSCEGFLGSFLTKIVGSLRVEVMEFCDQFRQTQNCLSDLKTRHERVQNIGRAGALKLFNGQRPHADRNENALPYITAPATSR